MTGVEIDLVVSDSRKALELYEKVFGAQRVEVTDLARGLNEAVFNLYGARFHLLDENADYGLKAPEKGQPSPIWVNIMVEDIQATFDRALENGCAAVQPVNRMEEYGVSNAIFMDPFNHQWLLHEMHKVVSFEEREAMWKEQLGADGGQG